MSSIKIYNVANRIDDNYANPTNSLYPSNSFVCDHMKFRIGVSASLTCFILHIWKINICTVQQSFGREVPFHKNVCMFYDAIRKTLHAYKCSSSCCCYCCCLFCCWRIRRQKPILWTLNTTYVVLNIKATTFDNNMKWKISSRTFVIFVIVDYADFES